MKQQDMDEILRHIDEGKATPEEQIEAEAFLRGMEERLSSRIDRWDAEEKTPRRHAKTAWIRRTIAAAACIAIIFSVTHLVRHSQTTIADVQTQKDTYDNPEEAAAEAEWALTKFSETINKAVSYNQ